MNNLFVIDNDQRFNKSSMKLITLPLLEPVDNDYTKRCLTSFLIKTKIRFFDKKNKIIKY